MENITEDWVLQNFYGNKTTKKRKKIHINKSLDKIQGVPKSKIKQKSSFVTRRNKAKSKNIEFSINFNDLVYPTYCPILGIELQYDNTNGTKDSSPSIDRIDNSKGYIKGNVQIISHRANRLKSDGTIEEFEELLAFLKNNP